MDNYKRENVLTRMKDDLRESNLKRTLSRDYKELKEFMLEDWQIRRLAEMGRIKRLVYISFWLLRSMYFKLTPVRRILLVTGLILLVLEINLGGNSQGGSSHVLGGLIILFILMLELKDKLLAQEELEAGHVVQEALMPDKNPSVPGWDLWMCTRPANEVGGDFVDYIKISPERFGLALADVAGKGLRAALITAKLQATLRALVSEVLPLNELLDKINRIFFRDSLRNMFASLVYLEAQPNNGSIRLINAGHLPPVIVQNGVISRMQKGGPALGLTVNSRFCEMQLEMNKGDLLLIFSDGVSEARNERGEFFTEQRLLESLPYLSKGTATAIGEQIMFNIDQFRGDAKTHDDISLIVLKVS